MNDGIQFYWIGSRKVDEDSLGDQSLGGSIALKVIFYGKVLKMSGRKLRKTEKDGQLWKKVLRIILELEAAEAAKLLTAGP